MFGIDYQKGAIAGYSRHIRTVGASEEGEELRDFLTAFAGRYNSRIVLIPLTDFYVLFLLKYQTALSEHFSFPDPNTEIVSKIISKTDLPALLAQHGLNHPYSVVIRENSFSFPQREGLSYPGVLKPMYQRDWENNPAVDVLIGHGKKVLLVDEPSSLERALEILSPLGDMVLQEYIPGPSEDIYYYVGYRNREGEIITSYIGNKIRTIPDCMGSETLLRSVYRPDLLKYGDEVLHCLDYKGPVGIDFKLDSRDNRFKIIEINCRIGMNDNYLVKSGIDLAYCYYLESLNSKIAPRRDYPAGITWFDIIRDLQWMRLYRKEKNSSRILWIKECFKHDEYALFDLTDPVPFLKAAFSSLYFMIKRIGTISPGSGNPGHRSGE